VGSFSPRSSFASCTRAWWPIASVRFAFSCHCSRVGSSARARSSVSALAVIRPVTGARKPPRRRFTSAATSCPCREAISALSPVTPELGFESAPQPTETRATASGNASSIASWA
jgi:hypothetical protein